MKATFCTLLALFVSMSAHAFDLPKNDCTIRFTPKYAVNLYFSLAVWVNATDFTAPFAENQGTFGGGDVCEGFHFKTQKSTSCKTTEPEFQLDIQTTLFRINQSGVIRVVKNVSSPYLSPTIEFLYNHLEERVSFKLESDGPHGRRDFRSRLMECGSI